MMVKSPKKLIEVALPLDVINLASSQEKTIRHGHPSNLHRWWARRPLVAARAVIFSQMVNDPSWKWEMEHHGEIPPSHLKASWAASRKRLFKIIEDLVSWENNTNEQVLERARNEILKSWVEVCELNKENPQAAELFDPNKLPTLHDPFAGGGAIPMEAQRLGLSVHATDLNPVAILINKAMIEIPPKFVGTSPIGPIPKEEKQGSFPSKWTGVNGLIEDVRRYAAWMRTEAQKRIGHLYPPIEITLEMARDRPDLKPLIGHKLTVIAWIWARTVKSPNPAFSHVDVPLASSYILSKKAGKEAYVHPVVEGDQYHFSVKMGIPPTDAKNGTKLARGANFSCIVSGTAIEPGYIKAQGINKHIGARLMAVVAEGVRGRIYLSPTADMEIIASKVDPSWRPEVSIVEDARAFTPTLYGIKQWGDLFTPRQLVALTTLSDLVDEAREKVFHDAMGSGLPNDDRSLDLGGKGALAYAQSISCYLALIVSKTADSNNSLCPWEPVAQCPRQLFGMQAVKMLWDFAEANPLNDSSGGFITNLNVSIRSFVSFPANAKTEVKVQQQDACINPISIGEIVSTDPPYYDNVPYADLSDFFYVWLRRSLKSVFPNLFVTLATPKTEELVAFTYRHTDKEAAKAFFLNGMTQTMNKLASHAHPAFPVSIYYVLSATTSWTEKCASTS